VTSSKKAGTARWRGIPVAFKVLALCLIALAALLMLLPAPPDSKNGGTTTITRHVPVLRDTVNPLAKDRPQALQIPSSAPAVVVAPPPPVVVDAPKAVLPKPPVRKPVTVRPPAPALEWTTPRIQAPKAQQQKPDISRLPSQPAPDAGRGRSANSLSKSEIREWVKSQAWEFLGGVDAKGNILYRFEVWLDAPQKVLSRIDSVVYDYDAPSATPRSRESNQVNGGFRARFGAMACSKDITVTLKMTDGSTRKTKADGCQALN
jgi:hypothetical protein